MVGWELRRRLIPTLRCFQRSTPPAASCDDIVVSSCNPIQTFCGGNCCIFLSSFSVIRIIDSPYLITLPMANSLMAIFTLFVISVSAGPFVCVEAESFAFRVPFSIAFCWLVETYFPLTMFPCVLIFTSRYFGEEFSKFSRSLVFPRTSIMILRHFSPMWYFRPPHVPNEFIVGYISFTPVVWIYRSPS